MLEYKILGIAKSSYKLRVVGRAFYDGHRP